MKNFVVKSLVLFVGVGLCSGIMLGMEDQGNKEVSIISSFCGV